MDILASNIKFLREQMNLKQAEICDRLNFKQSTWSGYEKGTSKPNYADLLKIIEFFDIDAGDLMQRDLQNVNLNENEFAEEQAEYVNLNVNRNVNLKGKTGAKEACKQCQEKDNFIAVNQQLLESKNETIEQLKQNISLLQNQIKMMEFNREEGQETRHEQRKDRKSA